MKWFPVMSLILLLWITGCASVERPQTCVTETPGGVKYACFVDDPHYNHDRHRYH